MINPGMMSSARGDWETPQWLFDLLDEEFHFTLDVCATAENAKCEQFITPEMDGLIAPWDDGPRWMNPPYGRGIGAWVRRAANARGTNVALLPARTDTAWWHDYVMFSREIRLLRGRLRFQGAPASAPFPSAVVVFDGASHWNPFVRPWDVRKYAA